MARRNPERGRDNTERRQAELDALLAELHAEQWVNLGDSAEPVETPVVQPLEVDEPIEGDDNEDITSEEWARNAVPHVMPYIDDIDARITADKNAFTGNKKKWSLVRARRAALAASGAYPEEVVKRMNPDDIRELFKATYEARREARHSKRVEKPTRTTVINQTVIDRHNGASRVWETDMDEPDIVARVRARRDLARGTAPKGASSPAATTPFAPLPAAHSIPPRQLHRTSAPSPFAADSRLDGLVKFDVNGRAHWTEGVADRNGKFANKGHLETILSGDDERQRQNTLFREAKKLVSALAAIETAVAAAPAGGEVAAMRRELVDSGAFGASAARRIGNMSDGEVKEFVDYIRSAAPRTTPPPTGVGSDVLAAIAAGTVVSASTTDSAILDAIEAGTVVSGPSPNATEILRAITNGRAVPAEGASGTGPEVDALMAEIDPFRDRYARLTAKDRTSYFGRFLADDSRRSRFLRRMPFVGDMVDAWNERHAVAIDDARLEYEVRVDRLHRHLEILAGTPEERDARRRRALLDESYRLEQKISQRVCERGGNHAGRFTTWWMKQEGDTSKWKWRSRLKKAGTIALAGTAIGFGAGFLLPGAIFGIASGAVAGGTTGGLIARHITRHRGNALVETSDGPKRYADVQAHAAHARTRDLLQRRAMEASGFGLTSEVERKTNEEMVRNRRRMRAAIAAGKLAGGLSGLTAGSIRANLNSGSTEAAAMADGASDAGPQDSGAQPAAHEGVDPNTRYGTGTPETPPAKPKLTGNTFLAEHSSGLTREWDQWADANGHPIDRATAEQLHDAVRKQFGDKGIIKQLGTYVENGDLRIARPGMTSWADGVPEFAQQWLAARGKW